MLNGFDDLQKAGKDNMDLAMKGFSSMGKGFQSIAVEMADYSKKAFEDGAATVEKLAGAKSFDKAVEIQTDYIRSSYEDFVAQASRIGELYAGMAKEAYKPFEGAVAKTGK